MNHSSAHVASLIYNKERDRKKTDPTSYTDFLPFDLTPIEEQISEETAQIFMNLTEKGLVPPSLINVVIDCGLADTIKKLGQKKSERLLNG